MSSTTGHTFLSMPRFWVLGTVLQISTGESDAKNRASIPPIKPKPSPLYSVLIPYQTRQYLSLPTWASCPPNRPQARSIKWKWALGCPADFATLTAAKMRDWKCGWTLARLAVSIKFHNVLKVPKIVPGTWWWWWRWLHDPLLSPHPASSFFLPF